MFNGINRVVKRLRKLSARLARRPGKVYFPEAEAGGTQNAFAAMYFGGVYVTYPEISEALYYIADMLEE